jgi:hypothetical protein
VGSDVRTREGRQFLNLEAALAPWRHRGLGVGIATWLVEADGYHGLTEGVLEWQPAA